MCIFTINVHTGGIMRTNVVIDDALMSDAKKITGLGTKKETIEEALRLLIKVKSQSYIKKFRGKILWEGNLESMRRD